jgi:ribosomal protein S18 acetylase RimI-like enzyme
MKVVYKWTDGNSEDFQRFYSKTEEYYSSIVGGIRNREGFVPYNISANITRVLIAYVEGVPAGCVGLKTYSENEIEIKRLWVDPEYRGNHIADELMDRIEKRAKYFGYEKAILQTRPQMEAAVSLYLKRGYVLINNYPPYDKLEGAICFSKIL